MPKQERRTFTPVFKKQLVELYKNGKSRAAIVGADYESAGTSFYLYGSTI